MRTRWRCYSVGFSRFLNAPRAWAASTTQKEKRRPTAGRRGSTDEARIGKDRPRTDPDALHPGDARRRVRDPVAGAIPDRRKDTAEDAFTALVHRHGPMVLGVCRRMLPNAHDAEDAFQATFLILARRAASIGRREQLANWLYGVAVRTAKEARRRAARQHARERRLMNESHVKVVNAPDEDQRDLLSLLDEELNALPPRYRIALVACELEGKSRREAAQQLGVPEGTLSTHLARGRKLLRDRLVRRGVSLGAGPFAGLARPITTITVSERLAGSTVRAALGYTSGGLAAGTIPATVASLAEGVLKMMLVTKFVVLIASLVALGLTAVVTGAAVLNGPSESPMMAPRPRSPKLKTSTRPAQEVAVHVIDRDGKPVSDALVTILDQRKPAADGRTDGHGEWKVRVAVDSKDWAIYRPQSQGRIRLRDRR